MKEIKIYVWDVSSSAGTKDKKLQGDTKVRTRIRNERDVLHQFLYTRELVYVHFH
jgi:hypothetical protein